MTAKTALTKRLIEALEPPKKADRDYHPDAKVNGLALCVTKAGAKTFYLYKKIHGRPERIRLGAWPDLTVENAR